MKKAWALSRCSAAVALALGFTVAAQDVNSSPSPVGSGARALGMGSAFIAIADDATAASWNPGGLTQLERPEVSLVYSWKMFSEDWRRTHFIHSNDDTQDVNIDDVNYFSVVYPIPRTFGGRNLVLSLNYQKKLDFDRRLDFVARNTASLGAVGAAISRIFVDYAQEGGLATLSPAVGFEITNKLSVGVTAHIWDSDIVPNNEWKIRNKFKSLLGGNGSLPPSVSAGTLFKGEFAEKFSDYSAINFTIGALYKPNERWSIGVVYHSHYDAEVTYEKRTRTKFSIVPVRIESQRLRYEWPSATGVGVAYRFPNDKLTLSFDVTRREWDDFVKRENRIAPFPAFTGGAIPPSFTLPGFLNSRRVSPITNLPLRLSPHDPTWTVRFGGEYVFVDEKKPIQNYLPSIRAGLFYDPEPASGAEDRFLLPPKRTGDPDDYYGIALGAGVLIKDRVNVDVAYQYRFGTNVKRDTFAGNFPFEIGFDSDVEQHSFYLSTVIYF